MAEINRNRVFTVDVAVRVFGTECTTRLYVGQSDSNGILRVPRYLAEGLDTLLRNDWADCLSENATYLGAKVTGPINSGVGSYVQENIETAGTFQRDAIPANVNGLVFLLQQDVDTTVRKRLYLAGLPEDSTTANRLDGATLLTRLATLCTNFRNPFTVAAGEQGNLQFRFCVGTRLQRLTISGPRYFTCTGTFISRNVAQYRRRNRRGIATPTAVHDMAGEFAEVPLQNLVADTAYTFGEGSGGGEG